MAVRRWMMRVVGIIPARFESSRFEGKALAKIGGKSIIRRVYEQAKKARILSEVIVATDDERIKKEVEEFKGKVVLTSPSHPTGTDRLADVAKEIEGELVVNIQGDQPFIEPVMIEEAVEPLIKDPTIVMGTIMQRMTLDKDLSNPNIVKVVADQSGFALYFSRSLIPYPRNGKDFPVYKHIGLYAYRKDFLLKLSSLPPTPLEERESLEQLRALDYGYKIKVVKTRVKYSALGGLSINTKEDLKEAEERLIKKEKDEKMG